MTTEITLDRIKKWKNALKPEEIDWLIEQVDRVQELETCVFAMENAIEIITGEPAVQVLLDLTEKMKQAFEGETE